MKTLIALLLLTSSAAAYEVPCVPSTAESALKTFNQSYSEALHSVALSSVGTPGGYMLTVNPDNSWTFMFVPTPGTVCVLATGQKWTDVYPLNEPPQR